MDRSKVTCSFQVCWRKLGLHQEGILWPSHDVHWTPCWLGSYFSSSSLMLLLYTSRFLLSRFTNHFGACRKFSTFFSPPFSLLSKSVWVAFWRHYLLTYNHSPPSAAPLSQVILGGYCLHWGQSSRCLLTGCHWLCLWPPTSSTTFLQWSGGASLLAGEEHLRGLWDSARCMLSSVVSRGFTKSWVGQVALRSPTNRHALDSVRPCCFIGRSRPLGTGFLKGSRCYSLICSFHHWDSFPTGSSLRARPGWLLF